MHPSRSFRWTDRDAMLAFARDRSFAHLFVQSGKGPLVAHVPVLVRGERILFHLARSNSAAGELDGTVALASFAGPEGYISPDWYGTENQVPTWNYIAVEAVGTAHRLPDAALITLLDELSAELERRLSSKPAWTREKMDERLFHGMLKSVVGFELEVDELRGTRKLGQNKSRSEQDSVIAALDKLGSSDLAASMRRFARER